MIVLGPFFATIRWRFKTTQVSFQNFAVCGNHGGTLIHGTGFCCSVSPVADQREWLLFGQTLRQKLAEARNEIEVQKALAVSGVPDGEGSISF